MKWIACLLAACSLLLTSANAQPDAKHITRQGFITALPSANVVEVNGLPVQITAATTYQQLDGNVTTPLEHAPELSIGNAVTIKAMYEKAANKATAQQVTVDAAPLKPIGGLGVIDLMPPAPAGSKDLLLRADGYLMLLPESVVPTFDAPLKARSDVRANVWITYHGTPRADGVVVLDQAEFTPNIVRPDEKKMSDSHEFDPSAVPESKKQSKASMNFLGIKPKRIPAWHDKAMQARVERIGNSLVPAYQRALPESDPSRIHFRFQVVDMTTFQDSLSIENGIILVPYQVVDRLNDDSRLAAVLADSIAEVLEKQTYLALPKAKDIRNKQLAGDLAGLLVPGMGPLVDYKAYKSRKALFNLIQQQSARVSLCLLHDAGYDLSEAAQAWWLLGVKPEKYPSTDGKLPIHAAVVYRYLGTNWRADQQLSRLSAPPAANPVPASPGQLAAPATASQTMPAAQP